MPFSLPISDPVLIFALAMLIILVAPLVFERLRIPGLVGLIVTGAVVGPRALGLLERDATFELLGTVGLLYLMFVAGLSLDLNQFNKLRTRSLAFGLISFLIPQSLAIALSMALLGYTWPQALLLGSIVGSHTLLAYPIVDRLGITRNTAVVMTMGGTMVTDVLSLLILAVVTASLSGTTTALYWAQFSGAVVLYVVAVVVALPWAGRWFFKRMNQSGDVEFVFLIALLFITAYVASLANLAPIIGAFLAGLVLNRLVPRTSPLMTRIRFVGDALFIPFFLLSVGMLVNLTVLFSSLTLWGLALLFTGLVLGGKVLAAKIVQRIYGYTPAEGWVIAGLSTPQAAATLAVTLIGFELNLFTEMTVNAVVVMILLTSLFGPSLVERFGRTVALDEERRDYEPSEAPQRILVPVANPETAEDLIDIALLIHDPASEQPIYPIAVVPDGNETGAEVAASEQLLGQVVVHAAAADVPVVPLTRIDLNPARGILRAMRENRISTLVIGWNGLDTARSYIFGSVLDQLLEESHELVFVCKRTEPFQTAQRILLLTPPYVYLEPGFTEALQDIKFMATQAGCDLSLVATEAELADLAERVRTLRPEVPTKTLALDRWIDLMRTLDDEVGAHDLIVLLAARQGTVSWRPSLDRLPGLIAQRFADTNFVTVYLSDVPARTLVSAAIASDDGQHLLVDAVNAGCLRMELQDGNLEAVFRQLLEQADLEVPPEVAAHLLATGTPNYAPELLPGVALYHAHTPTVERSMLLAGFSDEGLRLPRTSAPVHVLLILLVPQTSGTDTYLQQLTVASHLVRSREMVDSLRSCATAEEARHLLLDSLVTT
ncbi:MAG: cation:proton antiporter [Bacteroidota bacterium]